MGGPWVVLEGFLLFKQPADAPPPSSPSPSSPTHAPSLLLRSPLHPHGGAKPLTERYFVLYMNRKLEMFDSNDETTRRKLGDTQYVAAFAGWDGHGLLKAGESYGLELKVDSKPNGSRHHDPTSLFVAAFNRLDLEKWCRGLVAVLDPQSAAGEEVRRERRRVRKEEKRLQAEHEEKLRKWREKKMKEMEDEKLRLLAREEEINNMTPLERVDGLGSLDDDTMRILEKRKQRLRKQYAPTVGRVNKAAYRKRIEEGAGGKLENVQPLQTKIVETKSRVRVELPLPGQFIEAAPGSTTPHRHGHSSSKDRTRLGSSSSESSLENPSDSSSVSSNSMFSSGHSASSSHLKNAPSNGRERRSSSFVPPPPPPPPHPMMMMMQQQSSRSSFIPPPPPPLSTRSGFVDVQQDDNTRLSRTGSFRRGSLYDDDDAFDNGNDDALRRSSISRASFSTSQRRLSGVDRDKHGIQDNLAAILSGGRPKATTRRDSMDSTFSSTLSTTKERKSKKSTPVAAERDINDVFAASLAAIRRGDTLDEMSGENVSPVKRETKNVRNRKRDTQLSAEGKELLQKAISSGDHTVTTKSTTNGRKGLFDDSSSESDDSDGGFFGAKSRDNSAAAATQKRAAANGRKTDRHSSTTPTSSHSSNVEPSRPTRTTGRGFRDDDDDIDENESTDMSRSANGAFCYMLQMLYNGGDDETTKANMLTFSCVKTDKSNSTTSSVSTATPIQQVPSRVSVAFVSSIVQNEGKKPTGFFTFAFRLGAMEHSFTYSYNELDMIHARLTTEFTGTTTFPKFPSKHRLRNNIKPENMQKRALELVQYLQQLVAVPGMVSNQRFLFEFHIDGPFARALCGELGHDEVNSAPSSSTLSRKASQQHNTMVAVSPVQKPRRSQTNGVTRTTKQLFATEDSDDGDSDFDSDTSSVVSSNRMQQQQRSRPSTQLPEAPKEEPNSMKKSRKPSHRDLFAASESTTRKVSRRPSSTASHAPSESFMSGAPPASVAMAAAPKPAITGLPPRPNIFGGGRGDLLAAIRKGTELRKTTDAPDAAPPSAASLSEPRSAGAAPPPPPPTLAAGGSINDAITNAMASRRIHVEYEEAHSDDDDSDDDWD
ncbi:Px domain containing protein, partial [Globisporangium splendens]